MNHIPCSSTRKCHAGSLRSGLEELLTKYQLGRNPTISADTKLYTGAGYTPTADPLTANAT